MQILFLQTMIVSFEIYIQYTRHKNLKTDVQGCPNVSQGNAR
jgi:hypothetical protein